MLPATHSLRLIAHSRQGKAEHKPVRGFDACPPRQQAFALVLKVGDSEPCSWVGGNRCRGAASDAPHGVVHGALASSRQSASRAQPF